jgi:hypothetical protein
MVSIDGAVGAILALIHRWNLAQFLYNWQTLAAGLFALLAAVGTIWATRSTASRQIKAARKEADRVIAATRAQTEVTAKQTETTVRLAQKRDEDEYGAFRILLEAAMTRVLDEAAWARSVYPHLMTQTAGSSVEALAVRQCITKGAFAELRGACVRQGSTLTREFLDLEAQIDNFASQLALDIQLSQAMLQPIRKGKHAGLGEQLTVIEDKAIQLRDKAVAGMERANAVIAAPGRFATAEAEALIGAPAPAEPEPRRSWWRWRRAS